MIIGVNKYPNMDKDKQLDAARKDAEAVSKILVERYGFSKERMVELYDEAASRKGILRAFNSLKRRLTDKDSLFIYYAGHGEFEESKDKEKKKKSDAEGMGYWIPSDAEVDDPSSYIFNSQVRDYLANIDARHIYAVVDSCFSLSLMGKSRALGRGAIKELYQSKSRWILTSGGLYPVPDAVDKNKLGHSTFAWYFMKVLKNNKEPYLLAKDIAEPVQVGVSNEIKDQLPRAGQVVGAGDDGGQFVFRLKKEFQAQELSKQAEAEMGALDEQLKKAEEALKKQQEEMAKRKQAMLEKIKQAQEQAAREAAAEEERLKAEIKAAEEKAKKDAEERQARLKAEEERIKKAEEERLAVAKKFEEEQKERERKAKEAELARQKLEEEHKAEEARLAEAKRQSEEKEKQRLAELKRKEEERLAAEAKLAAERKKREEEEKARLEAEQKKMEELRKKQEAERDAARLAELKRQEEEARRKAEEDRLAALKREEEARKAEAERKRQDDLARLKAEEERKTEEARLAEMKRQSEEKEKQRLAELKRQEEERLRMEAEAKAAKEREEKRLAEAKKKQEDEEKRLAEERRKAEEKRLADERERTEREKQALLKRQQEEEARLQAERERLAAIAREEEEQKRKVEEARKKTEEEKKAILAQKEAAKATKTGEAPIVEATLRPFQAPKAKDLATVVTIPAGEFIMGSKPGDGQADESPQRTVYLDAYTIDKFEVTVEQYAAYLKKAGAEAPDYWERVNQKEDGNRPVVGVDWLDASEYCEYFGKRLPTEAQWEKAARGTDGRRYPWGNDDPGPLFANFATGVQFSYSKSLSPVGSFEQGKSPYGVYDMVGNVWEWILDWYDKSYYQIAPAKNPAGPASGDTKVIKGGSWAKRPAVARVAGRTSMPTSTRSNSVGFRCVGEAR